MMADDRVLVRVQIGDAAEKFVSAACHSKAEKIIGR
jgi:hypothetical protein